MQEPVCVTVQMPSVGQTVKVSTLRGAHGHYVLLDIIYSVMQVRHLSINCKNLQNNGKI